MMLQVQSELTRYLDDNWVPIIDKDVDCPNSLAPFDIDFDKIPTWDAIRARRRGHAHD
jgi:hypothetical protein